MFDYFEEKKEDKNVVAGQILKSFPKTTKSFSCLFITVNQRRRHFQDRCFHTLTFSQIGNALVFLPK